MFGNVTAGADRSIASHLNVFYLTYQPHPTPIPPQQQHHLVEFYATAIDHVKKAIADEVLSAPVPSASLQADVWTAPRSRADYLGVYISFLDRAFETQSYLLPRP